MSCCNGRPCEDTSKRGDEGVVDDLTAGVHLSEDHGLVHQAVQQYYGETITKTEDLRTSACCTAKAPPKLVRSILTKVPGEIKSRYYGCGSPFPLGIEGLRVLDLGCGTGRDCYVCSAMVGEKGFVTGIDMTHSQLDVAHKYVDEWTKTLGYAQPNIKFVKGQIEYLDKAGIEDESVDIVISNCVINLSPDKARVLQEVYRVLAPGGEMFFSDVYCDRRLDPSIRTHQILLGECLGGALYVNDFIRLCRKAGFTDPRQLSAEEIEVRDPQLKDLLGEARFYSITYRLFKVPNRLEDLCEDYGQVATYLGTIPEHKHSYDLDDHHKFITNKPMLVCGNTAAMVGESWMAPHFKVEGDRKVHYGQFDCGQGAVPMKVTAGGGCC